jgi:long-chain acyl-CoA synthetase
MPDTSGSLTASYPTPAVSVGRSFLDRIAATPARPAFQFPRAGGGWSTLTWAQTGDDVKRMAAGLIAIGVGLEDRVGIACSTRVEWILADLAVMCAGGATTTVYPTTQPEDVAYILGDSGVKVLIAEDQTQADKVLTQRDLLPSVERIVLIDGTGDGDFVLSLDQLRAKGEELLGSDPDAITRRVDETGPDGLATLIYTSGTTGRPKGVELTHRCWAYEGAAIESIGILTPDDIQYLWLPLAHSFGKVLLSAQLQIGFVTAVDGRVDQIVVNLGEVQPTFMAGVPRIFEKVYTRVQATATEGGGAKAKIFEWAFGVGQRVRGGMREGKAPSAIDKARYAIADRLVFSKVKERMGGRIRYFVSGSAALNKDIAEWFDAAGLTILEGYGLTETSAATCLVRPERVRFGTVGEPFPGTEIKIAEDGEILVRGPGVMRGYHNLPEQTAEVLLGDGWFATGDVGEIDDAGRVRITDRKKDLVKTSGGKYIAPGAIEAQFKAICGLASNMIVHVEGRNFATALVTLDPEELKTFAAARGLPEDYATASQSPEVRAEIQSAVDELNGHLNRWETIKDFRILDRDLTVEDGYLTPSLKLKRKAVETHYKDVLETMYGK